MLKERPLRYFERIAQSSLSRLASAFDMGPCARLLADESGQDMIEYALAAVLLGVAVVTAINTLGNKIGNSFNTVGNNLTNAI
jgi:pilus assembly protein Flp/PilA